MKKLVFICSLLLLTAFFCSCQGNTASDPSDGIQFEYFYRGFVHTDLFEQDTLNSIVSGGVAVCSQEDWYDFCKYLNIAGKYEAPDFSEYSLVVLGEFHNTGSTSGTLAFGIDKLTLDEDGKLMYVAAQLQDTGDNIWADTYGAESHTFLNILKVKAQDLPEGCAAIYKAAQD